MSDFKRYAGLNTRQGRRHARDDVRSGRALSAKWAGDAWEEGGHFLLKVVAPSLAGSEVADRAKVKTVTEQDVTCNAECWIGDRLAPTGEAGAWEAVADG